MNEAAWHFEFARPWWLGVLAVAPLLVYYARRGLVHWGRWQRNASLCLRLLLIIILTVALCGVTLKTDSGREAAVGSWGQETVETAMPSPGTVAKSAGRVLLIASQPAAVHALATALKTRHFALDVRPPQPWPAPLAELQQYDLLILSNISAAAVAAESGKDLQRYVRDFGGGLIVIGGDQAYAAGAYGNTAIEEILPVACHTASDRPRPSLALVLVVDRSDSMKGPNIALAKEAIRRAVERLGPGDRVGVIAFEEQSRWLCEIAAADDRERIFARIETPTAGGGTNMFPALDKAYLAICEVKAERKHIVLLTDGLSHPGDFEALAREIAAAGITLSTVAVGREAAAELLQELARLGQGRFHACDNPQSVPQVFLQETVSAGQIGISEIPFLPRVAEAVEVFGDLDLAQMPVLLGYAPTRLKPGSQLLLGTELGDPLLARWRYGRGWSVAFTSDAEDRWAATWLAWPGFADFWGQLAHSVMRSAEAGVAGAARGTGSSSASASRSRASTCARHPDDSLVRTTDFSPHLLLAALWTWLLDVVLKRVDFRSFLKAV